MYRTAATALALVLLAGPALAFGPESFTARSVKVDGVLGTLDVAVDPGASRVTVEVTGPQEWLKEVTVKMDGDRLVVDQADRPNRNSFKRRDDWIAVRMTVPAGTGLEVDEYIGEAKIGDLNGPLLIDELFAGKIEVGNVTKLSIGIDGSGEVFVGTSDMADIDVSGSGDVRIGNVAGPLSVDIAGSGDVRTGTTRGKVDLNIAGSGDIVIARVEGAVSADIAGSGDIKVEGGLADPLAVSIAGSGDFALDGIARSQSVSQSGSGTVKISGREG